jgi:hypothetical protein
MASNEHLQETALDTANKQNRTFYGKFRGVVTDNNDPARSGRIRASIRLVFVDFQTQWAMPCVPYASDGWGFLVVPELEDTVWIEFEGGDPSRPIWSGAWWAEGKAPPLKPQQKQLGTAGGQHILLDDSNGAMKIEIKDGNGNAITLGANGILLVRGGMKIEITNESVSINDGALEVTL